MITLCQITLAVFIGLGLAAADLEFSDPLYWVLLTSLNFVLSIICYFARENSRYN